MSVTKDQYYLFWTIIFALEGFKFYPYGGGGGGDAPEAPEFVLPEAIQGVDQETLDLIRSQIGREAATPAEFDISSQALQDLLGYQFDDTAFQLPIDQIQEALSAQQAIQKEQFLQELRPIVAAQGQLDSTGYTNRIADYIQGQQAQSLGSRADLLTQQSLQELSRQQQLNQFIPQFQAGIAQQRAGVGQQRVGLDQFNLQLPFQTTIPALQQQYQIGLGQAGQETSQRNLQFQADREDYLNRQEQINSLISGAGGLALAAGTGGASSVAGGGGFAQGTLSGLQGLPVSSYTGQTYRYQPSFRLPQSQQSQTLGFDTRAFR